MTRGPPAPGSPRAPAPFFPRYPPVTTLLKLSAAAFLLALAAIIGLSLIGQLLLSRGQLTQTPAVTRTFQTIALSLFAVIAIAIVPLFARPFLFLQGRIGNADLGPIRFLRAHELWISL